MVAALAPLPLPASSWWTWSPLSSSATSVAVAFVDPPPHRCLCPSSRSSWTLISYYPESPHLHVSRTTTRDQSQSISHSSSHELNQFTHHVNRPEGGEETNILRQIREQPEVILGPSQRPHDAKDNEPKHNQAQDEGEKARGGYAEIVDTLSHRGGPQREQAEQNGTDDETRADQPVVHGNGIVNPHVSL